MLEGGGASLWSLPAQTLEVPTREGGGVLVMEQTSLTAGGRRAPAEGGPGNTRVIVKGPSVLINI